MSRPKNAVTPETAGAFLNAAFTTTAAAEAGAAAEVFSNKTATAAIVAVLYPRRWKNRDFFQRARHPFSRGIFSDSQRSPHLPQ